ncbi:MAG: TIM-barrel domain-containing protein [Sphingomonas oligoaromativorans]
MSLRLVSGLALAAALASAAHAGTVQRTADGVIVTPDRGAEKAVRLQVYGDELIRVTETPTPSLALPASLMVVAHPVTTGFTVEERAGHVVLKTAKLSADVDTADGRVRFRDAAGQETLAESGEAGFAPVTVEGQPYTAVRQQWNRGTDEGLYGLGQHQNRQMNYNGEDVELAQHNMDVAVPFVVSTKNYGILWDNNSITRFGNPKPYAAVGDDALKVTGEGGQPGFTAHYYLDGKEVVTRQEATIDYQYIKDQAKWPAAARSQTVAATGGQNTAGNAVQKQTVVWTGNVTADKTGIHKFRLYVSSYVKVFADGQEIVNQWRQNWNPWYRNFELPMTAGKPVAIRIEWEPNAGYIGLVHNDPRPAEDLHSIGFASDVGHAVDYYYVGASSMDGVIAGYRALTGKAVMMPEWAYGFWQSRQRYKDQDEILGVLSGYRSRGLPLDNVVEDWFYWREDAWGSHEFDPARFPDPKGMIDRLHAGHAHFMISIWPKFYPTTDNYKELKAAGAVYTRNLDAHEHDWVGKGYENTDYDPYNPKGRAIYWRQVKERLAVLGVDAWWMDASEPDIHSNLSIEQRAYRMGPTAMGPGAAFFNSFPLVHAEGVADGWRQFKPDTRGFILTRSGFAGLQRTGAAVWSGDVAARWDDLRNQISAGVNFSLSGIPNWTHDIGGFAVEDRYSRQNPADVPEWRELYTRWFQFGAFSPLFRSHGEFPYREIYEIAPAGSDTYKTLEYYDKLRYRLLPYIYTLAADTYAKDGTIMRGLVMDFPKDRKVWSIDDQYLFGPSLLVAPVTRFKARSRDVYLPAGTDWCDFYAGTMQRGGRTVTVDAPYERIPVFVRAGSILPTGPEMHYTREKTDAPITLTVYAGADGQFSLYEDDGTSLGYQKGAFARVPLKWDDRSGTLSIGARQGHYPGMAVTRTFRIRWVGPNRPRALDLDGPADVTVTYTGKPLTVRRK